MFVEKLSKKEVLEFWKGVWKSDPHSALIKREIKQIEDKKLGKGYEMISTYQDFTVGRHHAAGNAHTKGHEPWTENVKLFDFDIKSENTHIKQRSVKLWQSFLKLRCGQEYKTNLKKQQEQTSGRGM